MMEDASLGGGERIAFSIPSPAFHAVVVASISISFRGAGMEVAGGGGGGAKTKGVDRALCVLITYALKTIKNARD